MTVRINECSFVENFPVRLDAYLSDRFSYLTRSSWQKEIKSGRILVNNKHCFHSSLVLKKGDLIQFTAEQKEEPPVDFSHKILFEDSGFIAVQKSGDMPVHPAGKYFQNTLLFILEKEYRAKLYPAHRIDRETSGIVLFAKNPQTAAKLQEEISNGEKTYTAIVRGISPQEFENANPIGDSTNNTSTVRKKRIAGHNGTEKAFTFFKTIFTFGNFSFIKAFPETGRLHQIRVHLEDSGFPIVGDKIYGGDDSLFVRFINDGMTAELEEKLLMKRCALHASSIKLNHPDSGRQIRINSPLPDDFISFIKRHRNG
ncbi:MAG: RluA family pseudouridine synthase [Spirochaetes bacterium]|nr:RluA family pseudouridine synthase [Spirochaetota bacterium]